MMNRDGSSKKNVDLHIHTKYSDGACSVREVLGIAYDKGVSAVSITDHDSLDAYPNALNMGAEIGIEVITGIEFSCEIDGVDVHIIGYLVDINNDALTNKLQELREARYIRAKKIVQNLNKQGIDLRFETVLKIAGEGAIGRPHIATAMMNEELIYSFKEAFDSYIGYDSPAYVEKMPMSPKEVFKLILDAHGIPIIAHPGVTNVDHHLAQFIRDGLVGIEVYHAEHCSAMKQYYRNYCIKHNLVMTGGSDFHGQTQTRAQIGIPKVSYSVIDKLFAAHDRVHNIKT